MNKLLLSAGLLLMLLPLPGWTAGDDILGVWNTAEGRSRVEVSNCGDRYCGRIIWLKEPNYPPNDKQGMAGQVKVDRKNPDPQLRTRALLGLEILKDFHYDGTQWTDGTIYDPKKGKTYRCKITQVDNGTLNVRGYIGISLIGRSTQWTRFTENPK